MTKKFSALIEYLFRNIPYSEESEKQKECVRNTFESELILLQEQGKNEVQAMGELMSRCGTYEEAVSFSGCEALPQREEKGEKAFKKKFRKVRLYSILIGWWFAAIPISVFQGITEQAPQYIFSILLEAGLGALWMWLFYKNIKAYRYEQICLTPDARNLFYRYSDRYKKRAINSILLLTAAIVYIVSSMLIAGMTDMTESEAVASMASDQVVLEVAICICFKNILSLLFLLRASSKEERAAFWRYIGCISLCCAAFLTIAVITSVLVGRMILSPVVILCSLSAVFFCGILIRIYRGREKFVRQNICFNRRRVIAFSLAAMVFAGAAFFRSEVYTLQPYLSGIAPISHEQHAIEYDMDTGVYTITASDNDFKILHLTDIHLGGSAISAYKDYKALEACRKLITYTEPDLVVITGDLVFPLGIMSLSFNNEAPVRQFAAFMRNIGIPWAFTFGNHDTESMATGSREDICDLYESLSYKTSGTLLYPYIQPDITGRSNQMIRIENPDGSIREALFLIDSNDYTGNGINDYDYIHDDQVEWYAKQIEKLNEEQGETVPSMLFFHIPLQEYKTAYELYQKESDEVTYHFGIIGETMMNAICTSDYPSKLFDKAVELGSTTAMFCGHDHYNNISLTYRGIRLTYGMSIDYLAMPGIAKDTAQRGAELITITGDSEFEIQQIPLTEIE